MWTDGGSGRAPCSGMVEPIFGRIRTHTFHPLEADRRTFTVDRVLRRPGVADLDDDDGRVRLSAVRDLTAVAVRDPGQVARGLVDHELAVRYLSAAALGIARRSDAGEALERVLVDDPEPVARAYAAIALGEAGATGSLEFLRARRKDEAHPDVRHQLELAAAQIESGAMSTAAQRDAFLGVRESDFGRVGAGDAAPDFSLDDTEGRARSSTEARGRWLVLVWVFADWCPVCHREFAELMALRAAFEEEGVQVATLEAHDVWRARLMVGREIEPELWGSRQWFRHVYTERIWWPHLIDLAGAVGAGYGTDPMAFAVHGEFVNRPTTVIVDPEGVVRFAYRGTFWGDRPSIAATLEMIRTQEFGFSHPDRLTAAA
jgi:alkyl hydroperoxide reductase subunit AhpC